MMVVCGSCPLWGWATRCRWVHRTRPIWGALPACLAASGQHFSLPVARSQCVLGKWARLPLSNSTCPILRCPPGNRADRPVDAASGERGRQRRLLRRPLCIKQPGADAARSSTTAGAAGQRRPCQRRRQRQLAWAGLPSAAACGHSPAHADCCRAFGRPCSQRHAAAVRAASSGRHHEQTGHAGGHRGAAV